MHGPGRPGGRGFFGKRGGGRGMGPFHGPGPMPRVHGNTTPSGGFSYSESAAKSWVNSYVNRTTIEYNTGSKLKGIILGSRLSMMGPMHESIYVSRIQSIDEKLAEKRITPEIAKYRKLKAAFEYNSYLLKCEYLTPVGFVETMKSFAGQIGALGDDSYIFEQVMEENGIDLAEYEAEKAKAK